MPSNRANPNHLFVLGTLLHAGPMHGHQIRREAQLNRTELWTDIHVGSLYGALHRMEAEGLIEAVRSEQQGRFPERTVYTVTDEGRREFSVLRTACLRTAGLPPDPFDLALSLAVDLPAEELRDVIEDRIQALTAIAQATEHQRVAVQQWLNTREVLTFRHFALRMEAELRWHRELLDLLPQLVDAADAAAVSPQRLEGGI